MNELIENIGKLHTTEMGAERIKRNLSIEADDVVQWCKTKILEKSASIERRGKNWYVAANDCVITVNVHSYTIITAHNITNTKKKIRKESSLMEKLSQEAEKIMIERFGRDNVIALATTADGIPYVRYVNAYYDNRAFYVITYGLSNKMKQIRKNPIVAISGEWFTAHGEGINLGYFGKAENTEIAKKLREAFAEWIDNGHNDFNDVNTCILCIKLKDGVLFSHGTRYDIDFMK